MTSDNSPSRSLARPEISGLPGTLAPELAEAEDYARADKAPATRRAYCSDFELFRSWCESKHVSALPAAPQTVEAKAKINELKSALRDLGLNENIES